MESKSFCIAVLVIVGTVLIASSDGNTVALTEQNASFKNAQPSAAMPEVRKMPTGKLQRQGRYYMGYPGYGGLGYGGGVASASASASASAGGVGMGYGGGYPYMYGR